MGRILEWQSLPMGYGWHACLMNGVHHLNMELWRKQVKGLEAMLQLLTVKHKS